MNSRKVAIIQNRIHKGGRIHVIIGLIRALNDMGITPDLITLHWEISYDEIIRDYGEKINFKFRKIFFNIIIPGEFHRLFFNFLIRFFHHNYSLIINSNNTSFLLPSEKNVISYVHYPRKDRLLSPMVSIHYPDGQHKSWFNILHLFQNIAALVYKFNNRISFKEKVIANSHFTKEAILRQYPINNNDIEIVYPPIFIPFKRIKSFQIENKTRNVVCSIGRFSPDKRQLEQLRIAEKLPQFEFYLIGFSGRHNKYFTACRQYLRKNNLKNVSLLPNVSYDEMMKMLSKSLLFLHSLRNEPFGITTVQAIVEGCIPIVHNSGGQKEIIQIEDLRYNSIDEAIKIFKSIEMMNKQELMKIQANLIENIKKFDKFNFHKKIISILSNYV